jgi:hypothetical protein
MPRRVTIPAMPMHIGPCEFSEVGALIAGRCPEDFDPFMRQAGGLWDPGTRRWLIERRRLGPLVRTLQRETDPLFRWAGMSLDEG